jgi:hypothetical protein
MIIIFPQKKMMVISDRLAYLEGEDSHQPELRLLDIIQKNIVEMIICIHKSQLTRTTQHSSISIS